MMNDNNHIYARFPRIVPELPPVKFVYLPVVVLFLHLPHKGLLARLQNVR